MLELLKLVLMRRITTGDLADEFQAALDAVSQPTRCLADFKPD
jgi:hypothetical protein